MDSKRKWLIGLGVAAAILLALLAVGAPGAIERWITGGAEPTPGIIYAETAYPGIETEIPGPYPTIIVSPTVTRTRAPIDPNVTPPVRP
jgi:hypothetical protein